ncbi:MAG: cell wall-binding repeat-containing protein, partial [Firmicutes bacterium]|nr:cell wall-binding repeat-containing protein [Bacillota bacterium]
RLAGGNRYETSFKIADDLYWSNGKFDSVIVAYGQNFPDALAGGYLAYEMNAPILLSEPAKESSVLSYIKSHAAKDATIFILGGTGVISSQFEANLWNNGYEVERLGGADRFETNLQILKAVEVEGQELLVSDGYGFADSLSGSAVGKPILIVNKNKGLSAEQKAWLYQSGISRIYILGGTGSVSNAIQNQLQFYAPVKRLGGANRHETSALIAKQFFPKAKTVTIAFSGNFPDGLSGAPIALRAKAPMLLVSETGYKDARGYVSSCGANACYVIGGTGSISDQTVGYVMGDEIKAPNTAYVKGRTDLPQVIYNGKYGTVKLNSIVHGWEYDFYFEDGPEPIGYCFNFTFENKSNQNLAACIGSVYLNGQRIGCHYWLPEYANAAPNKTESFKSFLYNDDITAEMRNFDKIECVIYIIDMDTNKIDNYHVVIDSSAIIYK